MFAWGDVNNGFDVNKFGNDVLVNNWSLTCEGTDAAMGGHIYYGFYAGAVNNNRVELAIPTSAGYGGYTVRFTYQIGGDTLQNYYGTLQYSTNNGGAWTVLKKYQKVWVATGATESISLPASVSNVANGQLKLGWSLNIPGTNLDYSPTFTLDNIQLLAYALPVVPTTPAPVGPATVCPDAGATVFTTSPGSNSYQWSLTGAIGASTITWPAGSGGNTATVYWSGASGAINICVQAQSQCGALSATVCGVVNIATAYTWGGTVSTDWNDPANWTCGGVPNSSTVDVIIPGGTPFQPTIYNGYTDQVRNITFNGAGVNVIHINSGGELQVAGTTTLGGVGTIDNALGTIEYNGGAAQTIPVGTFVGNNCYNLIVSQNLTLTATGVINLINVLSMTGVYTFTTNNGLVLISSATGTAQVSSIPAGGAISGNVTAQRFYPAHRAWRLISIPVVNAGQTVKQAFMEGVVNTALSPWPASNFNPNPGYGLHISGNSPVANGFDVTTNNNPSMMTYTSGAPGSEIWTGIANSGININTAKGYLLFVRGNRSTNLPLNTSAPTSTTVLRPSGTLRIGDQAVAAPAGVFTIVGNPYASTIDFHQVALTKTGGVIDAFSVIDPNINGANNIGGAWITFTWTGASYSAAPAPTAGISQNIQSGQAFLIQNPGAVGTLTIKEAHKKVGSLTTPFRPTSIEQFRTNLYRVNADATSSLADGVLAVYGSAFADGADEVDALKPSNLYENISHRRDTRGLAIEARPVIVSNDALYYNISLYTDRSYRFEFIADGLDHPGLRGYLHDNYLNTDSPVDLNSTTTVDFTTNSDPASKDNSRFSVIFTTDAPLPVTLKSIKAYQKNTGVQVEWSLSQEINMDRYEVEKSTTGNNFNRAGSVVSAGNSNVAVNYNWFDANPNMGANFYRVKMIDKSGQSSYSQIVKVVISKGAPAITVYPNPAVDGVINIQFSNVPKGIYEVKLINSIGQVVMTRQIKHDEGSSNETLRPDKQIAHGNYQLEVTGGSDNAKMTTKVIY
jgi:hypothetical protein